MTGWTVEHARMSRHLGAFDGAPRVENPAGITALVRAYFDGDASALDRIPVFTDGTPFQQRVWGALREIPAARRGRTRSSPSASAARARCAPWGWPTARTRWGS